MVSAGRVRPVHKGTWSAETEYSMLDIVITAGRTAAYIARQDVPAGIALTNTEYWDLLVEAVGATITDDGNGNVSLG